MANRLMVKATRTVANRLTGLAWAQDVPWTLITNYKGEISTTDFLSPSDDHAVVDDTPAARADGSLILLGEIEL